MISRATLLAAPGYVSNGTVNFRVKGLIKAVLKWDTDNVIDPLKGPFDKIVKDRWIEVNFTPLYRDSTNTDSVFFPYISLASTPPGTQIYGTSDTPWSLVGQDGLTVTLKAAQVTKMPDITAAADQDIFGDMQLIGINATGTDPSSSSSFYSISSGNSFTYPSVPSTATLLRQKWTAAYGSNSGWSAFQSYTGFKISHELGLNWVRDSGQRIGALITGYRAMAKCQPSGNTIAQLASQMAFQGSGASQGQRYSSNNQSDLVISGAVAGTITLKNANIESGDIQFAAEQLHQGEVGFITGIADSSGAPVASLVLA